MLLSDSGGVMVVQLRPVGGRDHPYGEGRKSAITSRGVRTDMDEVDTVSSSDSEQASGDTRVDVSYFLRVVYA